MKQLVLLTIFFPIFTFGEASFEPTLSKYRAVMPDPDVQRLNEALRRLHAYGTPARKGGNVSGGGENLYEMSAHERETDGPGLEAAQLGLLKLSAPEALTSTAEASTTTRRHRIAVIDSGLHPKSRAYPNQVLVHDFTGTCESSKACSDSTHGTLVSDLIVQADPTAELVVLKALDHDRAGAFSHVVSALKWVRRNHRAQNIKIVNLSLVSPDHLAGYWNDVDEAKVLIRELENAGLFIVSAVGNDFQKTVSVFPADVKESIAVGSYSHFFSNDRGEFKVSPFSNSGYARSPDVTHSKSIFHESVTRNFNASVFKPDVLAPGEGLFTCDHKSCYLATGTSFATGLFTGGLSRLLTKNPKLTRTSFLATQAARCLPPFVVGQVAQDKACAVRFDLETSN